MVSTSQANGAQAVSKAFALFEAILADGGKATLPELAARAEISGATSRRYAKLLLDRGLITRIAKGRYAGSAQLRELAAAIDPLAGLVAAARPILARAAQKEGATAHLGTYENEMVTYLVREGAPQIFTREMAQLEAYCTGVGKALLSRLPPRELQSYLKLSMVQLTQTTITDPAKLRTELETIRARGYAIDNGEMLPGLICFAVPLDFVDQQPCAISFSFASRQLDGLDAHAIVHRLTSCADAIKQRLARPIPN